MVVVDRSRDSAHGPNGMGVWLVGTRLGILVGRYRGIRCQFSDLASILSGNAFRSGIASKRGRVLESSHFGFLYTLTLASGFRAFG